MGAFTSRRCCSSLWKPSWLVFWFRHLNPKGLSQLSLIVLSQGLLGQSKGLRKSVQGCLPTSFSSVSLHEAAWLLLDNAHISRVFLPSGICQGCFLVALSKSFFLDWKTAGRFGSCWRSEDSFYCWLQTAFIIGVVSVPSGMSAICV